MLLLFLFSHICYFYIILTLPPIFFFTLEFQNNDKIPRHF